jgi:hypothetical protein
MLGLAELVEMDGESEPEAAREGRTDHHVPDVPFGVDVLDHGEGLAEPLRIRQGSIDVLGFRVEAPFPLDTHAGRLDGRRHELAFG